MTIGQRCHRHSPGTPNPPCVPSLAVAALRLSSPKQPALLNNLASDSSDNSHTVIQAINVAPTSAKEALGPHLSKRTLPLSRYEAHSFVHISKCAGSSWITDLTKLVGEKHLFPTRLAGAEHSFVWQSQYAHDLFKTSSVSNLISLRSPRHHVWSLYAECRYDSWGKSITHDTDFPRQGTAEHGFEQWLDVFLDPTQLAKGEVEVGERLDFFRCYHPSNFQSRHFISADRVCHGPVSPFTNRSAPPQFVPDPALVMQQYWLHDWVAITEFYHASKCLLLSRFDPQSPHGAAAQRVLREECWCNTTSAVPATDAHIVHHAGGHRESMTDLPPRILRKIDALTATDAFLYTSAAKIFMAEVRLLEKKLGRRVLCDHELAKADKELGYLFPSVSALYHR